MVDEAFKAIKDSADSPIRPLSCVPFGGSASGLFPNRGGNDPDNRALTSVEPKADLLTPDERALWDKKFSQLAGHAVPPINTPDGDQYRTIRYKLTVQQGTDLSALSPEEQQEWRNFYGGLLPGDIKDLTEKQNERLKYLNKKLDDYSISTFLVKS